MSELWGFYACERCGATNDGTSREKFFGGFVARLCNPCLNGWTEALYADDLWSRHGALMVKMNELQLRVDAGGAASIDELTALEVEASAIQKDAYALGKAYVENFAAEARKKLDKTTEVQS